MQVGNNNYTSQFTNSEVFSPVAEGASAKGDTKGSSIAVNNDYKALFENNAKRFKTCLSSQRGFPRFMRSADYQIVSDCYRSWEKAEEILLIHLEHTQYQGNLTHTRNSMLKGQIGAHYLGVGYQGSAKNNNFFGILGNIFGSPFSLGYEGKETPSKVVNAFSEDRLEALTVAVERGEDTFKINNVQKKMSHYDKTSSDTGIRYNGYSVETQHTKTNYVEHIFSHRSKVCEGIAAERNSFLKNNREDLREKNKIYNECIGGVAKLNNREAILRTKWIQG